MKGKWIVRLIGLTALLALAACSAPISAAAPAQVVNDKPRTITVTGTGEVYLVPDLAYINIGVESRAEQVNAALNENNAQAVRIAETLRELGVDERDIQTSAFSVYPMQEYGPNGEMLGVVYVVNNTVNITVRQLESMGELLDAVVRVGANTINSIQFDVENKDTAISEARRLAITNARNNAAELADAAGVELGELYSLNVYTSGGPVPYFDGKGVGGAQAASNVPVAAGQMVVTMVADLTYEIR